MISFIFILYSITLSRYIIVLIVTHPQKLSQRWNSWESAVLGCVLGNNTVARWGSIRGLEGRDGRGRYPVKSPRKWE